MGLPYATPELPGIGGVLRDSPEDFEVEEIPLYSPSGEGPHTFVLIEKRDLTTADAAAALARAFGLAARDVGSAGLKDKRAVARQWLSLPGVDPIKALAPGGPLPDGLRLLVATRHANKLRTGHLRGNRFRVVVRRIALPVDEALARATAILESLATALPNYYGEQRFGRDAGNAATARAFLRGESPGPRDRRLRRLLISSLQSEAFNRTLARRLERGLARRALDGDVLQRRDSGGLFLCDDATHDQPRLDQGEIGTTGPMPGPRMMRPRPGSAAETFEREALAELDLTDADLDAAGSLAQGTRRALVVPLADPRLETTGATCEPAGPDALVLRFALPRGSYATTLLREVQKSEG